AGGCRPFHQVSRVSLARWPLNRKIMARGTLPLWGPIGSQPALWCGCTLPLAPCERRPSLWRRTMAPHIRKTVGVILAVFGLFALATPMQAQQWGGLEEFNTLNTLPPGWALSPHGVGAGSPNNVWNVDANPTQTPGAS